MSTDRPRSDSPENQYEVEFSVWIVSQVAGSREGSYHTDPNCPSLARDDVDPMRKPFSLIWKNTDREPCSKCAIFVGTKAGKKYHTDPDCGGLATCERVRPRTLIESSERAGPGNRDLCRLCDEGDEVYRNAGNTSPSGAYNDLVERAREIHGDDLDLMTDGGRTVDRPAFIPPDMDYVECYLCGRQITDLSLAEGLDISDDDEYYPKMVPICRDNNHREPRTDGGVETDTRSGFECYVCDQDLPGVPWGVTAGTPLGDHLDLDPDQIVDVCDTCVGKFADGEDLVADGGRVVDDLGPCSECGDRPANGPDGLCTPCRPDHDAVTDGGVDLDRCNHVTSASDLKVGDLVILDVETEHPGGPYKVTSTAHRVGQISLDKGKDVETAFKLEDRSDGLFQRLNGGIEHTVYKYLAGDPDVTFDEIAANGGRIDQDEKSAREIDRAAKSTVESMIEGSNAVFIAVYDDDVGFMNEAFSGEIDETEALAFFGYITAKINERSVDGSVEIGTGVDQ